MRPVPQAGGLKSTTDVTTTTNYRFSAAKFYSAAFAVLDKSQKSFSRPLSYFNSRTHLNVLSGLSEIAVYWPSDFYDVSIKGYVSTAQNFHTSILFCFGEPFELF